MNMLNLNKPNTVALNTTSSIDKFTFKVLIYDKVGQDILSPLITVNELRKLGISLNTLLDKNDYKVSEIPAIYFVAPTESNIQKIIKNFNDKSIYENIYINFTSTCTRDKLELLATLAVDNNIEMYNICSIYDTYLHFIMPETNLITLPNTQFNNSYFALNSMVDQTQVYNYLSEITTALYSISITSNFIPIIKASTGGPSEIIAKEFSEKIASHLVNKNSLFTSGARSLFLILDRYFDLNVMLHHPWSYQALVNELFIVEGNNRIKIPADSTLNSEQKIYSLDNDNFWLNNKDKQFPKIAEQIQEQLADYQKSISEFKDGHNIADVDKISDHLSSTISSLPTLTLKKKEIDAHTNIASTILEIVKSRSYDFYHDTELKLMSKAPYDINAILNEITNGNGNKEDKLRLFIIFFNLITNKEHIQQLQSAIKSLGFDVSFLSHLLPRKLANMPAEISPQNVGQTAANTGGSWLLTNIASTVVEKSKDYIRGILPTDTSLPITKVVENLIENKTNSTKKYITLDPRKKGGLHSFNTIFVVVIGGGNISEYLDLQEFGKKNNYSVYYVVTDLCNSNNFLSQIQQLGASQPPK